MRGFFIKMQQNELPGFRVNSGAFPGRCGWRRYWDEHRIDRMEIPLANFQVFNSALRTGKMTPCRTKWKWPRLTCVEWSCSALLLWLFPAIMLALGHSQCNGAGRFCPTTSRRCTLAGGPNVARGSKRGVQLLLLPLHLFVFIAERQKCLAHVLWRRHFYDEWPTNDQEEPNESAVPNGSVRTGDIASRDFVSSPPNNVGISVPFSQFCSSLCPNRVLLAENLWSHEVRHVPWIVIVL